MAVDDVVADYAIDADSAVRMIVVVVVVVVVDADVAAAMHANWRYSWVARAHTVPFRGWEERRNKLF